MLCWSYIGFGSLVAPQSGSPSMDQQQLPYQPAFSAGIPARGWIDHYNSRIIVWMLSAITQSSWCNLSGISNKNNGGLFGCGRRVGRGSRVDWFDPWDPMCSLYTKDLARAGWVEHFFLISIWLEFWIDTNPGWNSDVSSLHIPEVIYYIAGKGIQRWKRWRPLSSWSCRPVSSENSYTLQLTRSWLITIMPFSL